jgi:hypothetical protein
MQNIPLFGASASLISPPAPTVVSGYFPLQYLPAENLNYYLNGATQAIQEWVNLITLAGLTPGTSQQGWAAISGLMAARNLSFFSPTTSAQLAGVISDETGSGSLVFANTPTLITPVLGVATATTINGLSITATTSGVLNVQSSTLIDASSILRSLSFKGALTYATTTTFSVAPGGVGDDTFVSTILLGASITKSLSAWAVGSGNGSLDTGAIAASTGYYVYLIKRTDTQVVDVLISLSATAPTMPTNYTLKRMIGWVLTNGSSQLVQWIGYVGGEQAWAVLTADVNDATLTTARKTYTIADLPNVAHDTKFNLNIFNAAGVSVYVQGDTNLNDAAPSVAGPVTATLDSQGAAFNSNTQINGFYMTGRSLFARASAASTTLTISIVSFNLRPYN